MCQFKSLQPQYVAMFDYTAADDDGVLFREGDYIMDANIIDDGWMKGCQCVEHTGQLGMLPSNYVKKFKEEDYHSD